MRNEELLNNLDTLKGIIHKMSSLPEDYDALHRADVYANKADELIISMKEQLTRKVTPVVKQQAATPEETPEEICKIIRTHLYAAIDSGQPVLHLGEAIHQWIKDEAVISYLAASKDKNTVWLRQVLTCGRPIAPVFKEYSDVIAAIIPELKPCIGFEHKSIYHKHNVYEHILAVVDGCKTNNFCVKMSALLHDIGKPHVCTTDETGHRHFHGHAAESVRLAKPVLSRLDTTEDEVKLILDLIEYHDMQLASTTNAVRRVKNKYGADFIRKWAILRQADRDDHVYPKGKNTQFYTDIEGILATLALLEYDEAVEARTFKPSDLAINGNDLIQELGFKEGPVIGTILHKLFEEVKAGKIKNAKRELLDESLCIFMKLPKETIGEQRQPDAVEVIDIDR